MSFSKIVGHGRPLGILRRALQSGRVAHAYLFTGPDGVGKATVARAFVAALQCREGGADACGACPDCRKTSKGAHPDVVWVEPQGAQILIGQIRDLQRQMVHRPLEGRWRTMVIDGAHDLNLQAANALLKTLEEPPPGNVLVLVARSTEALIPTIVSRCHEVPFSPLLPQEIARYLGEREGWPEDEAGSASLRALGSIGRALEMKEDGTGAWEEDWLQVMGCMHEMSRAQVLSYAQKWGGGREEALQRLGALQGLIRDLTRLCVGFEGVGRYPQGKLSSVGSRWGLGELLRGWDKSSEAMGGIERNWNPQLVMEDLLLEMHGVKGGAMS